MPEDPRDDPYDWAPTLDPIVEGSEESGLSGGSYQTAVEEFNTTWAQTESVHPEWEYRHPAKTGSSKPVVESQSIRVLWMSRGSPVFMTAKKTAPENRATRRNNQILSKDEEQDFGQEV